MEKATLGFRIYKIWPILKHFAGTFRPAKTLKLGGVIGNKVKNPDANNVEMKTHTHSTH